MVFKISIRVIAFIYTVVAGRRIGQELFIIVVRLRKVKGHVRFNAKPALLIRACMG